MSIQSNPSSPSSLPISKGDIVAEKYRVERLLGKGGMGVVVKATHLTLDEPVALKFVLTEHTNDEVLVQRFIREARAAVRIKSEHVARVLDVSALPSGTPFIVMEYLEGRSLEEKLKEEGPLEFKEIAALILQSLEALAEAHAIGIVHRDLKPANLFLTTRADGSPLLKVLDFGVSKLGELGDTGPRGSITTANQFLGSPSFMSPEQLVSAKDVDAGSDIWALGVTMYQLVSGALPFDAETLPQLCATILKGVARPLPEVLPNVQADVESVIMRCLAYERTDRYADVAELAAALAPFSDSATARDVERIQRVATGTPLRGVASTPLAFRETVASSAGTPPASVGPQEQVRGLVDDRRKAFVKRLTFAAVGLVIAAAIFVYLRSTTKIDGTAPRQAVVPAAVPLPVRPPEAASPGSATIAVPTQPKHDKQTNGRSPAPSRPPARKANKRDSDNPLTMPIK